MALDCFLCLFKKKKRLFCFGLTVVPEWVEESYLEGYEVLKRCIDSPASKTSSGEPQSHYWGYLLALNANKGTGLLDHIIAACSFNALSSKSNESGFNIIIEHLFVHEGVLSEQVCPCWREGAYEWIKAQKSVCVCLCAHIDVCVVVTSCLQWTGTGSIYQLVAESALDQWRNCSLWECTDDQRSRVTPSFPPDRLSENFGGLAL